MIAPAARHARCMIRGAPALVTFYPDTRIVRISTESGHGFEELRWLFGWQALLEAIGAAREQSPEQPVLRATVRSWRAQPAALPRCASPARPAHERR